ncbi:DUF6270 domain-containing protein [Cellulomonas bogoriensis]|uniref:Uncharacterized protein n=1 Tax=Cellulomonas bogoriensis 69B4 = DSM 16987 TaxID=1386082 RepID=A0A0A0C0U2_9CELL|nr:DUF6270 domain-containing protein [Cellulomonas bogoriensis]KGM13821.1 hypothetical protein N869_09375 [Cellulomonas bogoriensis 69B4 = DSM 16987]
MTDPRGDQVRVAVYGSCVSRDAVEYLDADRHQLVTYVARQSVISAFSDPVDDLDVSHVESPFQRRMLNGDAEGNLMERLSGAEPDVVLWDLTDERLGVLRSPHGEYLTRSVELIGSGIDTDLQDTWELIEFGTDEHFALWARAVARFAAALRAADLIDKVALVRVPWATRSTDGGIPPHPFGHRPVVVNRRYHRYYRHLAGVHPWKQVRVRAWFAKADPDHQWGHAPFHYHPATYHAMCARIETLTDRLPPGSG